jgi:flavin reductase (DIM6/NTAB) family NADH-FMN oxidoreductase RutF
MLTTAQRVSAYTWPTEPLTSSSGWTRDDQHALWRPMPEDPADVARDSRWPAFFPSPICLVTTGDGSLSAMEKVVGASIVNRFPYLVALSFCRETLSDRHYARSSFCKILESSGKAAVQFIAPGAQLDAAMATIADTPDSATTERVERTGLPVRAAVDSDTPVFEDSYLVYEAELVSPTVDNEGRPLFQQPWVDVGSHRIYFLRIGAIQMRESIARGEEQVKWRSLPEFRTELSLTGPQPDAMAHHTGYTKGYEPNYRFPAAGTIGFRADYVRDGMSVLHVPDDLITDNDDARWPCFFPQSAGIITSRAPDGTANVMPCGSTTVVSRQPLVIAPCVSYAAVNERYAPRASLDMIVESGWFGCGVPFINDAVLDSLRYAGNTSLRADVDKLVNSGFLHEDGDRVPTLTGLPLFYECEVIGTEHLGTHVMIFGKVTRIRVGADVSPENPLEWCPWPDVIPAGLELGPPSTEAP